MPRISMSALTSLLVRDGIVPVRRIEDALQRQVISGGDVETVLLEMGAVAEDVLAGYRASLLGLPAATRAELMSVPPDWIGLVPAEVAIERRVVPLAIEGRRLLVAAAEPLPSEAEEQLGFLLGFSIDVRIVCRVRLAAALAHFYGAELSPRDARLVERLAERDPGELPSVDRVGGRLASHVAEIPEKPHFRPRRNTARLGTISPPAPENTSPAPSEAPAEAPAEGGDERDEHDPLEDRVTQSLERRRPHRRPSFSASKPPVALPASDPPPPLEPSPDDAETRPERTRGSRRPRRAPSHGSLRRLRGPLTLAAGERLLRQAADRDQILAVLFSFARQFFDYTALFVVHDDVADGREASGVGASSEALEQVSIPLDQPSLFGDAVRALAPLVKPLVGRELDQTIASALERPDATHALAMPIAIRRRVVVLLYGDRDGERFDLGAVMELVRFSARVAEAFEQLILRRKRGYHEERSEPTRDRPILKAAARIVSRTAGRDRPGPQRRKQAGVWRRSRPPGELPAADDSWSSVVETPPESGPAPFDERAARAASALVRAEANGPAEGTGAGAERLREARRAPTQDDTPAAASGSRRGETEALDPEAASRRERTRKQTDPAVRTASVPASAVELPPSPPEDAPPARVLGVPRSAPPPPPTGELGMVAGWDIPEEDPLPFEAHELEGAVKGRDALPPGPPDAKGELEPEHDDDDEDDEPELTVEAPSDDEPEITFEEPSEEEIEELEAIRAARPSDPGLESTVGVYRRDDVAPEVVGGPRPRSSPPRDPRREAGTASRGMTDIVRVPDITRPSRPASSRPPQGLDADTRSVIVDMGEQVHAQVKDLIESGSDARDEELILGLLALGEQALPVLAQAFPGPLRVTRGHERRLPRGREVSAVARALVAFGERAVPYVASLLSSAHPDVRFYAAIVATEVVHPGLLDAVAERVHDEDRDVRRIAGALLARMQSFPGFDEILVIIRRTARIRGKNLARRWEAVDALAALRDVESIPRLIELLREDDSVLRDHVHRALVLLTGHDHGVGHRRWESWWSKNRRRHRIEWLIDGLLASDERVRAAAGEELKRASQQYLGYHPGSPKRDRELVQQRYLRWWEREGRARFDPEPDDG